MREVEPVVGLGAVAGLAPEVQGARDGGSGEVRANDARTRAHAGVLTADPCHRFPVLEDAPKDVVRLAGLVATMVKERLRDPREEPRSAGRP